MQRKTGPQEKRLVPYIRDAEEQDLDAICDLWEQLFTLHAQLDDIFTPSRDGRFHYRQWLEYLLQQSDSLLLIAEVQGKIIGYILATIRNLPPAMKSCSIGSIADMVMDERYRDLGLGRQLYEVLEERFRLMGITRLEVKTSSRNPQSNHFWSQVCGFNEFIRVHYKKLD